MGDRLRKSRAHDTTYAPVASTSPRGARAYSRTYVQPSASPAPIPSSSTPLVGRPQPSGSRNRYSHVRSQSSVDYPRTETTQAVATGAIGGAFGPYSYEHTPAPPPPREAQGHRRQGSVSRFTNTPSQSSHSHERTGPSRQQSSRLANQPPAGATSTTAGAFLYDTKDPELDDELHNPSPAALRKLDRQWDLFSARGWMNMGMIFLVCGGLIILFCGYPIILEFDKRPIYRGGYNLGGINASGQVPDLPNLPSLIDKDTPASARTRTGFDGHKYNLVFSDEFEVEGRTFYPGDDPFWEATDFHYWPTGDLEWYDPAQATTKNGALVIKLEEVRNHDLNFRSAMLQSWNKFCFTTGYIEVAISLPGDAATPGFWPGAWTLGNLARAGYGATTEGTWPYSYDSCDIGTFPQQLNSDSSPQNIVGLSSLPGQRLSSCSCPGSDHPGPDVSRGRGGPEIDIIEAQINTHLRHGEVSQSLQVAPFNYQYEFVNTTPSTTVYNDATTAINSYKGGPYQQCVSCVSSVNSSNYVLGGGGYGKYGFEYWSNRKKRSEGFVTWSVDDKAMWTVTSSAVGPDSVSQVSDRIISEEPMYIILNLGLSPSFQGIDFKNLKFPATMLVDYVRVYQRAGYENVGCDPADYPTADYINNHIVAYTNANLTTWSAANFTFPRNRLYDGC
ncbi:Beta-glucan synthesis-associated protein SKN1 [Ceratobasidium theobromae]|uniref:Beta-glucan synthesis-associated protein SKN1 n=1 Tax=Ceratobasidium theobromae TaxID=1582974 RepID=A0A5N5QXI3_9AGAM|nr:Beta-glucan synthesis-associated protein SKN1 [Ceratobasidium theobromae]